MNQKQRKQLQRKMIPILKKHDVVKAGFFGSFARGEERKNSDIDIVIKFKGRKTLLSLAALEIALEKKMGRRVDLLTYKSIHPAIKKRILKEEVKIL